MKEREETEIVTYEEIKCRMFNAKIKTEQPDATRQDVENYRFLKRWVRVVESWLLISLAIFILGYVSGCATAEAIGLGIGNTLQAAGSDTVKIVKAVSKDRNDRVE